MKPSELVPLSTLRSANSSKSRTSAGRAQRRTGYGQRAGARLASHPEVAKISFTGSTQTGRAVVTASAGNLKRLQLELGGKGANIVFEDANLAAAVTIGFRDLSQSRSGLHRRFSVALQIVADEFVERFVALAESIKVGDHSRGHRDGTAHLVVAP